MFRRAQALLELALFSGLMLVVLLAALSYQRNLREQKLIDNSVFEQAKMKAYNHTFIEEDIDGEKNLCTGGIITYNLNADRQANRLFQGGQRRTAAGSSSIYWSGAEVPPELNYNYYNDKDIGPEADGNSSLKKKIYYDRAGTANAEDDLKLSTAGYIAMMYPVFSSLLQGAYNLFSSTSLSQSKWWSSWGGTVDSVLRAAAFAELLVEYAIIMGKLNKAESERDALKDQDDEMGEWGWRVPDWAHDRDEFCPGMGKDEMEACENILGKYYIKDITAQVWDVESEENKGVDYKESQRTSFGFSSTRNVNVKDTVDRKVRLRFDVTKPDSTIPLAEHEFEDAGEKNVSIDLGGSQNEVWSSN